MNFFAHTLWAEPTSNTAVLVATSNGIGAILGGGIDLHVLQAAVASG